MNSNTKRNKLTLDSVDALTLDRIKCLAYQDFYRENSKLISQLDDVERIREAGRWVEDKLRKPEYFEEKLRDVKRRWGESEGSIGELLYSVVNFVRRYV